MSAALIAASPPAAAWRNRVGGIRYWVRKASLKRRRLEKPLAKAISVTGSRVSVSSCFANSSRRVCISSIGETPSSFWMIRRSWRELISNCPAISSRPAPSSSSPSLMRCISRWAMRCALSTGAWPGASSGRHRRHGRNDAFSAASAFAKKRQFFCWGTLAGQIGRQ